MSAAREGHGEFSYTEAGSQLLIERADSQVLVPRRIVDEVREGCRRSEGRWVSLTGDVLRIRATNRTVVYRLGKLLPDRDCYEAEWPD
ncbi:MAG: hypothetical protein ACRDPY_04120 [Streptosporangiaceae bacterium]